MSTPSTRPPRLPRGLGGMTLALPVLDAMGAEVAEQIPRRFCAIYTANGMSLPTAGARHRRVELVSDGRAERRVRLWQVDRAARPVPQTAQLHGRAVSSERPQGRPARLLRHVAHRRPAAQPEAGHVQLGRARPGRGAAHQAVLPAAFARAVDRRRHGLPLAHRHDFLQPGRAADSGGEQPAPRVRPPVPRRSRVAAIASASSSSGASSWWTPWSRVPASLNQQLGKSDRERMDQYLTSLERSGIAADRLRALDRRAAEEAGLLASESGRDATRASRPNTTATCST